MSTLFSIHIWNLFFKYEKSFFSVCLFYFEYLWISLTISPGTRVFIGIHISYTGINGISIFPPV